MGIVTGVLKAQAWERVGRSSRVGRKDGENDKCGCWQSFNCGFMGSCISSRSSEIVATGWHLPIGGKEFNSRLSIGASVAYEAQLGLPLFHFILLLVITQTSLQFAYGTAQPRLLNASARMHSNLHGGVGMLQVKQNSKGSKTVEDSVQQSRHPSAPYVNSLHHFPLRTNKASSLLPSHVFHH
eukprot:Gb_31369 [translate_table: standard]